MSSPDEAASAAIIVSNCPKYGLNGSAFSASSMSTITR